MHKPIVLFEAVLYHVSLLSINGIIICSSMIKGNGCLSTSITSRVSMILEDERFRVSWLIIAVINIGNELERPGKWTVARMRTRMDRFRNRLHFVKYN